MEYINRKHEARADVSYHEAELTPLIAFLSDGDYYQKWCKDKKDEKERNRKKKFVNMLLNSPNADCEANRFTGICADVSRSLLEYVRTLKTMIIAT